MYRTVSDLTSTSPKNHRYPSKKLYDHRHIKTQINQLISLQCKVCCLPLSVALTHVAQLDLTPIWQPAWALPLTLMRVVRLVSDQVVQHEWAQLTMSTVMVHPKNENVMFICLPPGHQVVGYFVSSVEHKLRFLTQTGAVCQSYNGSQWDPWIWETKKHTQTKPN